MGISFTQYACLLLKQDTHHHSLELIHSSEILNILNTIHNEEY